MQGHVKTTLAWHRDGVGPDVPVLQERYDNLTAERNELREQRDRLLEAAQFALSTPGLIRGRDSLQKIVDEVLTTIEQSVKNAGEGDPK